MKCHICGARLENIVTDLPFKVSETAIVILKGMPVLQCENCREYLIEDKVLEKVDRLLEGASKNAELEVVRYAA
ncbi:YgiT-type zinc finger protein [Candidatus Poribacteria bacterium]|nr:YgiT-type zinc finger protein [Candidatus Poribacteria bacterium]